MSTNPNSPGLVKAGIILLGEPTGAVQRMVTLQYNPDSLSRSFQVQGVGGDAGGEHAQPHRLKGPAVETIKLDAEIDATDALEHPERNAAAVQYGIAPQLALLEGLVNPTSAALQALNAESQLGTLEILPPEAPLALFVWGPNRIVPVRITEFSITEEAFDPALNPIRARVSLGMRVMTTDDLGFAHRGGGIFLNYLRNRESLARKGGIAPLRSFGIDQL